jgi:uncharacterized protein YbjT (DUF2867 family)
MILVTGATGNVGREVVAQLLDAGANIRVMTRNPATAHFDLRVQTVRGDFEDSRSLLEAVGAVDSIFSLAAGPSIELYEARLVEAARSARVQRIVKLSVLGAGGSSGGDGVLAWHSAGESAIRRSGMAWTILRPGVFMSNAQFWNGDIKRYGKVFSNFEEGRIAAIHPKDIASVAVHALTTSGHDGKIYPLTGPEALTIREQVSLLAKAINKSIEVVPIGDDDARNVMVRSGMPSYLLEALLPFSPAIRSGAASQVLGTVEEVTGKKPRTFVEWAHENATLFL